MKETEDRLAGIIKRFQGISCAYSNASGSLKTKCFGFADKEENAAVNEDTVFPACSISKFITAICVMKEYEAGKIDIDSPVDQYLEQWKLLTPEGDESDATIRDLLCHTSGIVDGDDAFYGLRRNDPPVSLINILEGKTSYNSRPARSEKVPGTEFEYTDAGYCVLHLLLQDLEQKPFEEVAKKQVFAPLGLKNTFFASSENIALYECRKIMASGYDEEGQVIPGKYPQVPDLAASGLWSSPKELLVIAKEFVKACNGGSALLTEKSALEMVNPVKRFPWTGLGVFMGGEDEIVTRGWGENGQSILKINYRTGEISAVMTNQNPGVDQTESGIEWLVDNVFSE